VPGFINRTALAAPTADKPGAKDTILVVIELTGGNDGLNTVIPFNDPEYAKLRPTLKQPENLVKKINDDLAFHPAMAGIADLFENKPVYVVQPVAYPTPSQSHFRSMDIWQAASTAKELPDGWLGRALQNLKGAGAFHFKGSNDKSPL